MRGWVGVAPSDLGSAEQYRIEWIVMVNMYGTPSSRFFIESERSIFGRAAMAGHLSETPKMVCCLTCNKTKQIQGGRERTWGGLCADVIWPTFPPPPLCRCSCKICFCFCVCGASVAAVPRVV